MAASVSVVAGRSDCLFSVFFCAAAFAPLSRRVLILIHFLPRGGQPIDMTLIRTDVGCSDSQLFDKHTNWDPNGRTFFLNEIEYGGTTYFIRHLKEDRSLADLFIVDAVCRIVCWPGLGSEVG